MSIYRTKFNPFTKKLQWVNEGSGDASWGSITGTLTDQTDLNNALDNKITKPTQLNNNSKLILNFNSFDADTFAIDESDSNHSINFINNAQIDIDEKKFDNSSLYLDDSTLDYINIPYSSDFNFVSSLTTDITVDFFIKLSNLVDDKTITLFSQRPDSAHPIGLGIFTYGSANSSIVYYIYDGDYYVPVFGFNETLSFKLNDGNWHHIAWIKIGDKISVYVDGNQVGYGVLASTYSRTSTFEICGSYAPETSQVITTLPGWLDAFHITYENYFSANPNSGKTDTIIVPTTAPYNFDTPIARIKADGTLERINGITGRIKNNDNQIITVRNGLIDTIQ